VDQNAHLATGLERHADQGARQLGRREVVDGDAATVEALERAERRRR
jgi:hypothetical protein